MSQPPRGIREIFSSRLRLPAEHPPRACEAAAVAAASSAERSRAGVQGGSQPGRAEPCSFTMEALSRPGPFSWPAGQRAPRARQVQAGGAPLVQQPAEAASQPGHRAHRSRQLRQVQLQQEQQPPGVDAEGIQTQRMPAPAASLHVQAVSVSTQPPAAPPWYQQLHQPPAARPPLQPPAPTHSRQQLDGQSMGNPAQHLAAAVVQHPQHPKDVLACPQAAAAAGAAAAAVAAARCQSADQEQRHEQLGAARRECSVGVPPCEEQKRQPGALCPQQALAPQDTSVGRAPRGKAQAASPGAAAPMARQQQSAHGQQPCAPQAATLPPVDGCGEHLPGAALPAAPKPSSAEPQTGPAAPAAAAPASRPCRQPLRLRLCEWGLPPGVVQAFESKGVRSMYPWQAAALECGERYNNLVYCAPTSGGKSLVAEVLMIRRLLASQRDIPQPRRSKPKYGRALVVLPYVSIVCEKSEHLAAVLAPMRAAVRGFFGGEEGQALAPRGETVAICTIEKANVAINRLAQEGRLGELCCVVVDELHMVADGDRGIGLEMSLSKLMFSPHARHVQVIGMSATMGGLEALRAWLHAELFLTNFRPTPLTEHAVFRGKVYEKIPPQELKQLGEGQPPLREVREVAPSDPRRDADRLVPLVAEAAAEGHPVLVFCSSRKQCESAAALIAELLPQVAPPPADRQAQLAEQRAGIVADIKAAMGGAMSAELEKCMMQGIAWHHAGLTSEERAGVERAYRGGAVCVVTATSTLAAGVNLPARRVILRSLHQGVGPVPRSQYLQMVGRAGRAGHAAAGEAFLIGRGPEGGQEWSQICALLTAPVPSLQSRVLAPEAAAKIACQGAAGLDDRDTLHLQQLLLEGIANGTVRHGGDVERLVLSTFAAAQQDRGIMGQACQAAFKALMDGGKRLVRRARDAPAALELTHKGRAVYDSALPLDDAMQLYDSCRTADQGFMLDRPLVLVYHCLLSHPFCIVGWAEWGRALQGLHEQEAQIAESVGVSLSHVHAAQSGRSLGADVQQRHARLAAALALSELTQERDVHAVVAKWGREGFVSRGLTRGQIQKLQQDAGKWMGMAALLCESAGWWPLATLYSNLSQMAAAGVRQDLLPLMKIPDMDAAKARALFKTGLRDAQAVATADEQALARVLAPAIAQQMRSRSSASRQQQRSSGAALSASAANYAAVCMAARAASTLIQAARDHLQRQVAELAALAADIREDEAAAAADRARDGRPLTQQRPQGGTGEGAAPGLPDAQQGEEAERAGGGGSVEDDLSPEDEEHIQRHIAQVVGQPGAGAGGSPDQLPAAEVSVAPAARLQWTQGVIRVTELRPRTPALQLEQFFVSWAAQPSFSLAAHTLTDGEVSAAAAAAAMGGRQQQSAGGGGAAGLDLQRLQGLAVYWDSQQAFYLELTEAHLSRQVEWIGGTLLDAVRAVLARGTPKLVCYGAVEALPELLSLGLRLGGRLEDPLVAAALLWPDAAAEDPARLELRKLQAAVAPSFKARVPNLCRGGVTSTCRAAVLALACMEPLRQLLAHRRMLEAFANLECPAALAVLHVNASAAAPRLQPPALQAALEAARGSADAAQAQLRSAYGLPQLDLADESTLVQLLGSLHMPAPERGRGPPAVPLEHMHALLARCRPHQQRERDVLACMVQHKTVSQLLVQLLQALLEAATAPASAAAPYGEGASGPGGASTSAAAAAGGRPGRRAGQLRLAVDSCSGLLGYGGELSGHLSRLLSAEWSPFLAVGSSLSVQAELDGGSLSPAAVAAAAGSGCGSRGLPVALCLSRRQLAGAAPATGSPAAAPPSGDDPPEEEGDASQQVWVAGLLVAVLGKRLCTALHFGAGQHGRCVQGPADAAAGSQQRASLALVLVPLVPAEGDLLASAAGGSGCSAGGGGCWSPAPPAVEVQWPCDQLWRLAGPSAQVLCTGCGGGGLACGSDSSMPADERQTPHGPWAAAAGPPLPQPHCNWWLHGYCSGASIVAGASCCPDCTASPADDLPHKPCSQGQQQQQSQPQRQPHGRMQGRGAGVGGPGTLPVKTSGSCGGGSAGAGTLLRVDLLHVELAVLAHLSGQPELRAACSSGGDAFQHVANCWAAAAGQLEVPGSGGGGGSRQPALLIRGALVAAVVQCLAHGWSPKKLGWVLRCSRHAAAHAVDAFLSTFPRVRAWLGEAAAAAEAACCAATLAGRQRQFPAPKSAVDAMARGKLHKAILQHILGGSVADTLKAALVSTQAALAALGPLRSGDGGAGADAMGGPGVALALGHSLVLHLPGSWVARWSGSDDAAAAAAAAVLPGLRSLYVGRVALAAPLGARLTAGPTLHLFDQRPVAVPSVGTHLQTEHLMI